MQVGQRRSDWQPQPFLWQLLRRNAPIALFLLVAMGGMLAVYWFFQPDADAFADGFAAAGLEDNLAAPIHKSIAARPVEQRFVQSPGPLRIAIISGHKAHDAGAVCEDGLTEAAVNQLIADKVLAKLQAAGIRAHIFDEFDARLAHFSGTAVISIHADSCEYVNDLATGFKIAGSSFTDSSALSTCLQSAYAEATSLPFHVNTITADMTDYHAFREISPGVPAVILETGFMFLDRELLTRNADIPADGITEGILCFLQSTGQEG